MMTTTNDSPRVLVAGVGNIFLGDDAFGVEVVQRLARRPLPEHVRVVDFGIRSLDLAYALLDGYESVILVDAVPRGGRPGELYLLEPDLSAAVAGSEDAPLIETHNMAPAKVLRLAASQGAHVERLLVVGCEPATSEDPEFATEMSAPVRAAVDQAVAMIESLLREPSLTLQARTGA
jgi:hydrogenase maturation protease